MASPIRIFISSPGDVVEEREKARRVIDELQRQYGASVALRPVLWEDLALPATASFQETIDLILGRQPIDIAVFIIWSRLGSPLGPAIMRPDGTPYRSGTEREFDIMLAAFRQSGQRAPVILAYTRKDDTAFSQSLANYPPDGLDELVEQRKLADSFIRETFRDQQGHNIRAFHSYPEPVSFALRLRTHLRQILDERLAVDLAAPRWLHEPYRGLEVFDVEHAPIFHGREEETCDLLDRLREQQQAGCAFAVVVGASGSGKSSLARAGVAGTLTRHADDEGVKQWREVVVVPGVIGADLFVGLVRTLADKLPELNDSTVALSDVADGLVQDASLTVKLTIIPAFAHASAAAGGTVRLLLILDQMEELWTDRRISAEKRERFLEAIEAVAHSSCVAVLATLRSDFYAHAQLSAAFLRLKGERGHFDLVPPSTAALQRLITEPARQSGLRFERDERTGRTLDQLILEDAARDPAALPLLQYVLGEVYRQRDEGSRTLTFSAYDQLGGVEGALGKRAAETYTALPDEARAALGEILSLLVTVDVFGEQSPVRRRATLRDLTNTLGRRKLTEALIAARFLTTDQADGLAIASLAHEALLRRWDQLAAWVTANREHLRLRARVEQSQQRWQQTNDPSLLLPAGLPLEEGRQLLAEAEFLLSSEARAFIHASIDHHTAQQTHARRRRRAVMTALSLLTAIAIAGGSFAWVKQREAATNARLAEKGEAEAQRQRKIAETRKDAAIKAQVAEAEQRRIANEEARKFRRRLAQNSFQHALSEEVARRVASSQRDLFSAWSISDAADPLRTSYARVLEHRLTAGGRRICLLMRHKDWVRLAAFSPDGTRVLTGAGTTARLWDAKSGAPVGEPMRQEGPVYSVAFSPDGTRVLTSSNEKARLWDGHTGLPLGEPMLCGGFDRTVAFTLDGTKVFTTSKDNSSHLWDGQSGAPLGKPLQHEREINCVAFSPVGTCILTGSDDATARLWDAASGAPVGVPMRHELPVDQVAFSPDGTRVLTSTRETARLWDAQTGAPRGEPMRHDDGLASIAFSPDGTRVLTADDKTARVWDGGSGAPLGEPMRHEGRVRSVSFSPDGTRVLTASGTTARLWDAQSGAPVCEPMGQDGYVDRAVFSPDGTRILIHNGESASFFDAQTGAPLGESLRHTGLVAFSPDGIRILTTSGVNSALWDGQIGIPLGEPMPHEDQVNSVAFSPDGTRVVTGFQESARLWDSQTGAPVGELLQHKRRVFGVTFSPDGTRVLTGSHDNSARLWDSKTGGPLGQPMRHDYLVLGITFSPDGTRVLTGSVDGTARLWDGKTGTPLGEPMEHEGDVNHVAFSPDGTRALTGSDDNTARLWHGRTGAPLGEPMCHKSNISSVAFSPDGTRVITGAKNNIARLWDGQTGTPLSEPMPNVDDVNILTFSSDGTRVLTGTHECARLRDGQTGAVLGEPMRHEQKVNSVAFSPDGTRVLTGSDDNTARLWNGQTGAPEGEPMWHDGKVVSVAFSPDGTRVITGSEDKTARIWDGQTGAPLGEPIRDNWPIKIVAFSPDGTRVLTRSNDDFPNPFKTNMARLWDATTRSDHRQHRMKLLWEYEIGVTVDEQGRTRPIPDDEQSLRGKRLAGDTNWLSEIAAIAKRRSDETRAHLFARAVKQRNWFAIAFHIERSSPAELHHPDTQQRLGEANAELRLWYKSVQAYKSAWSDGKGVLSAGTALWSVLLATDQQRSAQRIAAQLLERTLPTVSDGDRHHIVRQLLHRPISADDSPQLLTIAENVVQADPENADYRETLGAALFRVGRYEDAVTALNRSIDLRIAEKPTARAMCFLCLAEQQLNRPEQAKSWRSMAEAAMDGELANNHYFGSYPGWQTRLQFQWLRDEMQAAGIPAATTVENANSENTSTEGRD